MNNLFLAPAQSQDCDWQASRGQIDRLHPAHPALPRRGHLPLSVGAAAVPRPRRRALGSIIRTTDGFHHAFAASELLPNLNRDLAASLEASLQAKQLEEELSAELDAVQRAIICCALESARGHTSRGHRVSHLHASCAYKDKRFTV